MMSSSSFSSSLSLCSDGKREEQKKRESRGEKEQGIEIALRKPSRPHRTRPCPRAGLLPLRRASSPSCSRVRVLAAAAGGKRIAAHLRRPRGAAGAVFEEKKERGSNGFSLSSQRRRRLENRTTTTCRLSPFPRGGPPSRPLLRRSTPAKPNQTKPRSSPKLFPSNPPLLKTSKFHSPPSLSRRQADRPRSGRRRCPRPRRAQAPDWPQARLDGEFWLRPGTGGGAKGDSEGPRNGRRTNASIAVFLP